MLFWIQRVSWPICYRLVEKCFVVGSLPNRVDYWLIADWNDQSWRKVQFLLWVCRTVRHRLAPDFHDACSWKEQCLPAKTLLIGCCNAQLSAFERLRIHSGQEEICCNLLERQNRNFFGQCLLSVSNFCCRGNWIRGLIEIKKTLK